MEKRRTFCAVYSIIQIHFVSGIWEEKYNTRQVVYALPGSDANLTCQILKTDHLVQAQWSKVTDEEDLIAVYHPEHGFYCPHGRPPESLVAFTEAPGNVTNWTLFLRNISSSFSGNYQCSFTMFPEGIQTKIYNLVIQTHVAQEEWRSSHTIEININQTLKIPCFQNISAEISELTVAWSVEINGTQETLISQERPNSTSALFKDRVKLHTDHGLYLSPVQIQDDDRKFSCQVRLSSGKTATSSTTVKIFAKPEKPVIMENNSLSFWGERTFTCLLKNVFPKANLTWFIDGRSLEAEKEGIYITNEERKGKDKLLELTSILKIMHGNQSTQSNNLTIWCEALSSARGNSVYNLSSEKITFSWESTTSPAESVLQNYSVTFSVTESTNSIAPTASNSHVTTQDISHSWTSSGTDAKKSVSWLSSETHSSSSSSTGSTLQDDIFTSTTRPFTEVPTTASGSTKNNHTHITGIVIDRPNDGMSWPAIVAVLLFVCISLFGLGIRKWCQYQKEIMERPPPFKPPPPPVKYTCIQESISFGLPCHEMELLYPFETSPCSGALLQSN
ncbi:T-cell surface protein tactile [Ochotona curzoniae]|uniref:T-cell surface protein tactile n=1 Tax=Ochotona curzoniae TaxID=130825 RepID=UPI001B354364|nr:T-cell surface protein tactile [Ochotona curzoniae]